jgi:hypothetical protein
LRNGVVALALLVLLVSASAFVLTFRAAAPNKNRTRPAEIILLNASVVSGKHAIVHVPAKWANIALQLVSEADYCIDFYAKRLKVETPNGINIYVFDDLKDYELADSLDTGGKYKQNRAFSKFGRVYIYAAGYPEDPVIDGAGFLEMVLAHELCHAVMYKSFPAAPSIPVWLREGISESWSEDAMSSSHPELKKSIYFSRKSARAKRALLSGKLESLQELADPKLSFSDNIQQRYAEAYMLTSMLQSRDHQFQLPDSRQQVDLPTFLRNVLSLPKSSVNTEIMNSCLIGKPGSELSQNTQNDFENYIKSSPTPEWIDFFSSQDVHRAADGGIVVASNTKRTTCVLRNTDPLLASKIDAVVTVSPAGDRQVDLLFAGDLKASKAMVICINPRDIYLQEYDKKWEILAKRDLPKDSFLPGKHVIQVVVGKNNTTVQLDKTPAISFPLNRPGKGMWGIGCYNSLITFNKIEVKS